MRATLVALLTSLALAGPAAAIPGNEGIYNTLRLGHLTIGKNGVVVDKSRSCQAGTKESKGNLLGTTKRPAVVACEQPPRSEPLTPDKIGKATAAALGVLG